MATIRLRRVPQMVDLIRSYKVIVDTEEVGAVRRGQEVTIQLPPGHHRMWLRMDWNSSNTVEFVSDGTVLEFECGSHFAGWRTFVAVKHLFSPTRSLWIRPKEATRVES